MDMSVVSPLARLGIYLPFYARILATLQILFTIALSSPSPLLHLIDLLYANLVRSTEGSCPWSIGVHS